MANKILGITNDITTCECCGRSDLKATIVIGREDGTVLGYFGANCARNYVKGTKVSIERAARYQVRLANEIAKEASIQAKLKAMTEELMAIPHEDINYELRQRVGDNWKALGLNVTMTPEARREIYIAYLRRTAR